jgi:type I restriction enzyme M protein
MAAPRTLKSILAILDKDAGIAGELDRLGQLAWMLLLKALDDRELEQEIVDERYRSPIDERFRWRSFTAEPRLEGEALLVFVNAQLIPALASSAQLRDPTATLLREVFQRVTNRMKSPLLLRQVIDALDEIDTNHLSARRALQDEFERLLGEGRTADGGDHFTPAPLARLLVEMVDPELGETIFDPSCGSGAFLVAAVERLRDRWVTLPEHETALARTINGATRTTFGWLLATTNLLLHGLVVPTHVACWDALERPLRDIGPADRVDVLLSATLFGGLAAPTIADGFPLALRTMDRNALHIQQAMHLLRPEGRAALVVPDGMLFANGVMPRVREKLLEECDVHTIVRLPGGVFAPYSGIRASVIFLTRGRPTKEIWYYDHRHPDGLRSYSRKLPLKSEDFDPLRAFWNAREESDTAFRVPVDAIKANDFNLAAVNPREVTLTTRTKNVLLADEVVELPRMTQSDAERLVRSVEPAQSVAALHGSVRVRGLRLRDYRGFAAVDLELPKTGSTVLIGINGAGKSTLLDAIAQVLSPLATLVSGGAARYAEIQISSQDVRFGEDLARAGMTLDIEGELQHWELRANRAKGTITVPREISAYSRVLIERLGSEPAANLPILCFYPANRGLGEETGHKRGVYSHRQQRAYDRAFRRGLGVFQDFLDWFRAEEDVENEVRLRVDPSQRNSRLEVVRRAVQSFLGALGAGRFSELRMERFGEDRPAPKGAGKHGALIVEKDGVPLRIEQLSEGEKNTILLVSDLARRLSEANPGREDPLTGAGVVLIDEIDAHLHPGWQRGFLPALEATFPGCQFIVSTHSPQVLSRVEGSHVFIFREFKRLEITPYTYGRDSSSILSELMAVADRPDDITAQIHRVAALLDDESFDEARKALAALGERLGDNDVEVIRLRTALAFLDD